MSKCEGIDSSLLMTGGRQSVIVLGDSTLGGREEGREEF